MLIEPRIYNEARMTLYNAGSRSAGMLRDKNLRDDVEQNEGKQLVKDAMEDFRKVSTSGESTKGMNIEHSYVIEKVARSMNFDVSTIDNF